MSDEKWAFWSRRFWAWMKDGHYLTRTEHHAQFGTFWESLHPLCRWGGRFNDGNHYSLAHGGRA